MLKLSVQVRLAAGGEEFSSLGEAEPVPRSAPRARIADDIVESGAYPSVPSLRDSDEPVSFFIDDLDAAPPTRQASRNPKDEPA